MTVREIMTAPVHTIRQDQTLEEAANLMVDERIGCLPVVDDDGKLVGILTIEDFMAHEQSVPWAFFRAPKLFDEWLDTAHIEQAYERARSIQVRKNMSAPVHAVRPEDPVGKAVGLMIQHGISHIPVTEDRRVVGLITRTNIMGLAATRKRGSELPHQEP